MAYSTFGDHSPYRVAMERHGIHGTPPRYVVERRFQQTTFSGGSCSVVSGYHQYTFVDRAHEQFVCIVCHNVAKDIHQVTCCGKHLCKDCLEKCMIHRGEQCPHCRKENVYRNNFPDTNANQQVLSLVVRCPNSDKGCSWQGELRSVQCHASQCDYCVVKCKCGQDVMKCHQEKHNSDECGLRIVACPECDERGRYNWVVTGHQGDCSGKVIECPNHGCRVTMKRRELAQHRKTCPKEQVMCRHSRLGCTEMLPRENLIEHEQHGLRQHFEMAEARIKQLAVPKQDEILYSNANRVPITFQIKSFQSQLEQKEVWVSEGFYTDVHGYKLCLKVHLNGTGCGKDSHISYFFHLMPGIYDDELPWPFQGKVVVQMLNQLEDRKHSRSEKQFLSHIATEYNKRVCGKTVSDVGLGEPRFFSHHDLVPKPESNIDFVKDGSLHIQVHKIDVYSVPQS